MTNYHYRNVYEWQYEMLCFEAGEIGIDVTAVSDYVLLQLINALLKKLNCIPFTFQEMQSMVLQ